MKNDICKTVTDSIIADLEKGVRPWMKPWNVKNARGRIALPRRMNGDAYRGINILMLWGAALDQEYASPCWMTFKQAQEHGGHVRRGELSSTVVYFGAFQKTEPDDSTGEESQRQIPFLKSYSVFNTEQIEGLPEGFSHLDQVFIDPVHRIARAEDFVRQTNAQISHGGERAFYAPASDKVVMPPFPMFRDAESYYAVLCHELTHWTGHPTRLQRKFGRKGKNIGYAAEELVAELGAAFLCAELQLTPEVRDHHASYIASWLTVLKNDKRAIFTAAADAQRAADFLMGRGTER